MLLKFLTTPFCSLSFGKVCLTRDLSVPMKMKMLQEWQQLKIPTISGGVKNLLIAYLAMGLIINNKLLSSEENKQNRGGWLELL